MVSAHQQDYYYAPKYEQCVAYGVGHGVAHCGDGAADCILHGAERGRCRAASGAAAERYGRRELEYAAADDCAEYEGY